MLRPRKIRGAGYGPYTRFRGAALAHPQLPLITRGFVCSARGSGSYRASASSNLWPGPEVCIVEDDAVHWSASVQKRQTEVVQEDRLR